MLIVESASQEDAMAIASLSSETLGEARLDGTETLVARDVDAGSIVGFIALAREEPCRGHILALAVDREHQGRGIGSALLREARQRMVSAGAKELALDVRADDSRAQAFYARHGFEPSGLQASAYRDGEDAVHLTRPI